MPLRLLLLLVLACFPLATYGALDDEKPVSYTHLTLPTILLV